MAKKTSRPFWPLSLLFWPLLRWFQLNRPNNQVKSFSSTLGLASIATFTMVAHFAWRRTAATTSALRAPAEHNEV
jgi:hypothetical protein